MFRLYIIFANQNVFLFLMSVVCVYLSLSLLAAGLVEYSVEVSLVQSLIFIFVEDFVRLEFSDNLTC